MSSNTPNLGLLKKDPMMDGNETFNIETMLNENWDKVDEAVGKVREDLGNIDVDIPEASLTDKGIVQLSNATSGTRENVAATEKAVKAAYDEALAGKQLGIEQKANVVAALNSIGVAASTSETWAQLVAKMAGVIKATGNAIAGDVLAGKTFSNGSGNGMIGTMTYQGATNIQSGDTDVTIPAGYYNGLGRVLPNPISPGDVIIGNVNWNSWETYNTYPTKCRSTQILKHGTYRITFDLYSDNGWAYGRIYKNNVPYGIQRSSSSGISSPLVFIEDLYFSAGDTCELWLETTSGRTAYNRSFSVGIKAEYIGPIQRH